MEELIQYIFSTFNKEIDIDAKQFYQNAKLKLLEKDKYTVYVPPILFPEIEVDKSEYYELVEDAFEEWSNALNRKIIFQKTTTTNSADILVYWVKSTRKNVGMQYKQNNKHCISIGLQDTSGNIYDYRYVYSIILHEIGHILGLGHSPCENDIMNAIVKSAGKISKNDRFVLNLIYDIGNNKTYQESKSIIDKYISKQNKREICNIKNQDLNEDLEMISMLNKRNLFLQKEIKKYKFDN